MLSIWLIIQNQMDSRKPELADLPNSESTEQCFLKSPWNILSEAYFEELRLQKAKLPLKIYNSVLCKNVQCMIFIFKRKFANDLDSFTKWFNFELKSNERFRLIYTPV